MVTMEIQYAIFPYPLGLQSLQMRKSERKLNTKLLSVNFQTLSFLWTTDAQPNINFILLTSRYL